MRRGIEALDHQDAAKGCGEVDPAVGLDPLTVKEDGQQHRENGGEVLDDRGAGQRDVPDGVKEQGQPDHAHHAPDDQPFAVVTPQRLALSPEPDDAKKQADDAAQEDQLRRRKDREGLDQQVGGGVEHHRLQHKDQAT